MTLKDGSIPFPDCWKFGSWFLLADYTISLHKSQCLMNKSYGGGGGRDDHFSQTFPLHPSQVVADMSLIKTSS